MRIAFYEASKGNWFDKAIGYWTASKWCHCELVFDEKVDIPTGFIAMPGDAPDIDVRLCFSSSPRNAGVGDVASNGCRFKHIDLGDGKWTLLSIPSWREQADEQTWANYCAGLVGRRYDWTGIFGFVFGPRHNAKEVFCSEACTMVLQHFGVVPAGLKAWRVDPGELYELLGGE